MPFFIAPVIYAVLSFLLMAKLISIQDSLVVVRLLGMAFRVSQLGYMSDLFGASFKFRFMEERWCLGSSRHNFARGYFYMYLSFLISPRLPAVPKTSGQVPALRASWAGSCRNNRCGHEPGLSRERPRANADRRTLVFHRRCKLS